MNWGTLCAAALAFSSFFHVEPAAPSNQSATRTHTITSERDWLTERLKRECDRINQQCIDRCQDEIKVPVARKPCYKACNFAYARCLREAER